MHHSTQTSEGKVTAKDYKSNFVIGSIDSSNETICILPSHVLPFNRRKFNALQHTSKTFPVLPLQIYYVTIEGRISIQIKTCLRNCLYFIQYTHTSHLSQLRFIVLFRFFRSTVAFSQNVDFPLNEFSKLASLALSLSISFCFKTATSNDEKRFSKFQFSYPAKPIITIYSVLLMMPLYTDTKCMLRKHFNLSLSTVFVSYFFPSEPSFVCESFLGEKLQETFPVICPLFLLSLFVDWSVLCWHYFNSLTLVVYIFHLL